MAKEQMRSEENGFDRLDRTAGQAWSRFWGAILGIVGLIFAWNTFTSESFSFATHWPGLLAATFLVLLASHCWRSREGMLSMFSDVGNKRGG